MDAGKASMDSVSRRTRSRWDKYYRNQYNGESDDNGGRGKRVRNEVDSDCIFLSGDAGKKHNFAFGGVKRGARENTEHVESFGSRRSRSFSGKKVAEGKDKNVASNKKRKLDTRSKIDDDIVLMSDDDVVLMSDDDVVFLGEQVFSNGSSLKTWPESRSGSGLKVGDLDEVISSIPQKVESTKAGSASAGNSENRSQRRPRIKPLDEEKMHYDVTDDLERSINSGNSTESLDESDNSDNMNLFESESTSEEDDELSDKDYRVGESSTAESSDDSDSSNDVEPQTDDEYGGENENLQKGEEENSSTNVEGNRTLSSTEEEESYEGDNVDDRGSNHCKRSSNQSKLDDLVIIINEEEFSSVRRSRRISVKKETKVELERDDEVDEGYHDTNDGSGHNRKSANWKKDEDVVTIFDNEEQFPSIRRSAKTNWKGDGELDGSTRIRSTKKNQKGDGELDGSTRIFEPRSNYGCMNKARKDRDTFVKKKSGAAKNLDLITILVESMNAPKEQQFTFEENDMTQNTLPLKFRFEDEVLPSPEKSEWEKHIDSLFGDLELGLRVPETDSADSYVMENDDLNSKEIDKRPAACCGRGEHQAILDEQIGIVCKYCHAVILEIRYVLPDFYIPPTRRQDCKDSDESPRSFTSQIQFPGCACNTTDSTSCAKGTVWDLIPGVRKEMFPHQHEGFEFMWRNIAGDIVIEKLKQPLSDGRGCIISHAPGTGKTRTTLMFLQTFLKLYPTCCPVIIAPKGVLLTWESEFIKWNVNIPFHILNKEELTGNENAVATKIFGHIGAGVLDTDCIRLLKLYSWSRGGSILGISYTLFKKLAGENGKEGQHEKIREVLLERPGLLVLDEGHTPRNERSQIWMVLEKVATQRRIILSGTPFQNNMIELYNTLCLVNPKFVNQIVYENDTSCKTRREKYSAARKRWVTFIGESTDDGLKKLRAMLDEFVHVHKGIKESLPGLRHTLVFLHPTECQKTLLEISSKEKSILCRILMVSLVSVHPSLEAVMRRYSAHKNKLEEIESDVDAGVKAKFVMKLIWLADALGERVLVFSQYIDPLVFLKKQIESQLSWTEGRELLYMTGQVGERQRQDCISSFNDDTSEAKVLLASTKACSEGINLIGASRVILLDTVWNPSVEKQAMSRAYRLGQKKVVYVYRLFTSGIEVRQYAQQYKKDRISQLIFSPGIGSTCQGEKSPVVSKDKVLETMLNLEKFNHIFEKIIYEPKESDLIEIFGLEEQN